MKDVISQAIKDNRAMIADLEGVLGDMDQLALEPVHRFSEGLYARELTIPAGSVVVGKIHKHAHLNVIMSGRVTVTTPFGSDELEGPVIFESKPDTKRAVYAHTDTVWITFHPTEETDIEVIEEQIILKDYSDNLLEDLK